LERRFRFFELGLERRILNAQDGIGMGELVAFKQGVAKSGVPREKEQENNQRAHGAGRYADYIGGLPRTVSEQADPFLPSV
jgi:hypothetical protein